MTGARSLRLRLIAAVIATTALVTALAASATWMASARARGLAFDQAVRDLARALRPQLEVLAWRHGSDLALASEELPPEPGHDEVIMVLRGADGREYAHHLGGRAAVSWPAGHPQADGVLIDAEVPGIGAVRWMELSIQGRPPPPGERQRTREPPPAGDGPLARLVMMQPTRGLRDELVHQAWLLSGMASAVCALTAVLVALVIHRLLRPLSRLGDGIAGMAPGSRATLAVPGLPQELLPVQARLNELMARVDQVLERERHTTANIAHELRTPLAGLRARLELALLREREPEQIAGFCRAALSTMTLLQSLVDNLLLLARLEAGQAALHAEAVEVAEAVAGAWSLHQVAAEERGLHLERAIEPALALTTDAGKLRAILGNLLSNAVAYADPRSLIRLEACEREGGIMIVVANEGATIAAADSERVFELFWRGDAARTVEGHCGLGLALVRRLAAILGGSVSVAVVGRSFRVTVLLPEASQGGADRRASTAAAAGPAA